MAANRAPAARAAEGEQSEREYQATINDAIRDTEGEIAASAFDEDEPENDGDTSLEEMGEGLEGEVEGDADGEGEEEAEGDAEDGDGEGAEADEGEAEPDGGDAEFERDNRGRFEQRREPAVPPGRLREQTQRATAAEERAQALERQVAEMNGRLAEISARTNAPPQRQAAVEPKPEPDPFSDLEGWKQWNREENSRIAREEAKTLFTQFQQQQHEQFLQRENVRVDASLSDAANGERGIEFGPAYLALTTQDKRDPRAHAAVAAVYNSPNPGKALFDWWDRNGGPEFRERFGFEEPRPQRSVRGRGPDDRSGDRRSEQTQPRHVIRGPQRLPSLNSATGSNSQRVSDPEALDGSEESVFRSAFRR